MDNNNYLLSSLCLSLVWLKVYPVCPVLEPQSLSVWGLGDESLWFVAVTMMGALVQRIRDLEGCSNWLVPPSQTLLVHVVTHSHSPFGLHANPQVLGMYRPTDTGHPKSAFLPVSSWSLETSPLDWLWVELCLSKTHMLKP